MPNEFHKTINTIDIRELKRMKIEACILDLDQTLVEYHTFDMPPVIRKKFNQMKKSFKCCIVSNFKDLSERQIRKRKNKIERILGIRIIVSSRKKPNPMPYILAIKYLKKHIDNTVMIGNSNLTDVIGGNKIGMYTIQVKPFKGNRPLDIILVNAIERTLYLIYRLFVKPETY